MSSSTTPTNSGSTNNHTNNNESPAVRGRRASMRAPKVGHKKSRKGCQTCKARRVKCDETYPECGICLRLGLECSYAAPDANKNKNQAAGDKASQNMKMSPGTTASHESPPFFGAPGSDVTDGRQASAPPNQDASGEESKSRRFMELRLMHHWMMNVSRPFGMTSPPDWRELWHGEVPKIALEHENVLHAMLSMAATHLLGSHPEDKAVFRARQNYWVWALREQGAAVSGLESCNTDAVAFAALLITMNALAMLQERPLTPYAPPMDWLEVGRGTFTVLPPLDSVDDQSKVKILIEATAPIWSAAITYDSEMRREFTDCLDRSIPSVDTWDEETVESYEVTLSYIGSFRRAIMQGDAADVNLRWICMFPFMVPRPFIDFVGEKRPRALVVLAYFFAVVAKTDALQYLGNLGDKTAARREIHAIRDFLPSDWQHLMAWPLSEVAENS